MAKKIVTEVQPHIVYTSPCGRVTVERHGNRDYMALLDGQPCGCFSSAFEAEAAGNAALTDALAREVIDVADEAAELAEVALVAAEAAAAEVTTQAAPPINISLRLALQIGAAFERNQQKIGLTRRQVFTLMDIAATIIEREIPPLQFVKAA